ncbi:HU family DNA-binding protein [Cohaesibacter haloalkalitolerans]|uniref:HU family DNA-binding protein n=1 Tax=Cohaesibacter haloalkalitolerans TaxID=1162980 RepID=UPI000E657851|nr:HU family DNA-binding protein [Cohaesibacter haloalkalitolerans]
MNKNELISAVAEKADLTKAQAGEAVDALFDIISDTLKSGDEVRIIGFGNFSVTERAATEGRNPRTGDTIQIPASKTPKFKAGKGLKDAVNSK